MSPLSMMGTQPCTTLAEEHRAPGGAFGRWVAASPADPAATQRLRTPADTLGSRDAT
ncbi:MAG: hypothetical protein WBA72_11920 [Ornithinimicrobium sp.]